MIFCDISEEESFSGVRAMWQFLLVFWNFGCVIKSGIQMTEAEQTYNQMLGTNASEAAVYEWAMARAYMRKAREEFSNSEYERAEELAKEAMKWSVKAKDKSEPLPMPELDSEPAPQSTQDNSTDQTPRPVEEDDAPPIRNESSQPIEEDETPEPVEEDEESGDAPW